MASNSRGGEASERGNSDSASSPRSKNDPGDDVEPKEGVDAGGGPVPGKKTEVGTINYPNGDVYEGELKDGKRHGRGICRDRHGNVYDGEWKDDRQHGRGTLASSNGDEYKGQFVEGKVHGRGTVYYHNGDVYEGEWKDNLKHGKGKQRWKGGAIYEGEYKENEKHGKGTYKWADGDIYEGDFVDDVPHGWGTATYSASGSVFEGPWMAGKQHGKGTVKYPSGDIYEGVWTDGQRENKGIMKWANGDIQTGCFVCAGGCKLRSHRSQQRRLEADKKACEHCGNDDYRFMLRVCTGCGLALYCSIYCQRAARGSHQRICNNISELPSRDSDRLVLTYGKDKLVDLDAGMRYGTKYMDNIKHLEINLEAMSKGDKSVKLSAKQLSSLLSSKKGKLESVFWLSHDYIQAGGGDGRIEHGSIWTELHALKQLRLEFMRVDDAQPICDIIGQQKNNLVVLSLPLLQIQWSRAKCRRSLALAVSSCEHLVKLDLNGCALMDSDLKIMLNGLTNLRVLFLGRDRRNSHEFTDNTCGLIARKCPGLQELDLHHHDQLSVRGVRKIFEGCVHLRSFETTTRKLSCKDVQSLLDIAPQLLCLSLNKDLDIAGDELSNIIEATGGRTVLELNDVGAVFEPDHVSAETKEKYLAQIDALRNNVWNRRRDPEVANEWVGMLEG